MAETPRAGGSENPNGTTEKRERNGTPQEVAGFKTVLCYCMYRACSSNSHLVKNYQSMSSFNSGQLFWFRQSLS
ncbi:hypothetical protein BgiBS90_002425 [Biomphalaria glabrata]|nr:hypothetical protein BgiBS90_002425 [Biomphalaria glabrata]